MMFYKVTVEVGKEECGVHGQSSVLAQGLNEVPEVSLTW